MSLFQALLEMPQDNWKKQAWEISYFGRHLCKEPMNEDGFPEHWPEKAVVWGGEAEVSPYWRTQRALAGVAQWIECRSVNWKVTGSTPGQVPGWGCAIVNWLMYLSTLLFLSLFLPPHPIKVNKLKIFYRKLIAAVERKQWIRKNLSQNNGK